MGVKHGILPGGNNINGSLPLPSCTWRQRNPSHSPASCPSHDRAHKPGRLLPSQSYTVQTDTKQTPVKNHGKYAVSRCVCSDFVSIFSFTFITADTNLAMHHG